MDTTANLPSPAAHAAGTATRPAGHRRDGPAGEGFAATLKLAEAPAVAAPLGTGPGQVPAAVSQAAAAPPAIPLSPGTPPLLPSHDATAATAVEVAAAVVAVAASEVAPVPPPTVALPAPAKLSSGKHLIPASTGVGQAAALPVLVPGAAPAAGADATPEGELRLPAEDEAEPAPEAGPVDAGQTAILAPLPALPGAPPLPLALPAAAHGGGGAALMQATPGPAAAPSIAHGPGEGADHAALMPAATEDAAAASRPMAVKLGTAFVPQPMGDPIRPVASGPAPAPAMLPATQTAPVADGAMRDRPALPDSTRSPQADPRGMPEAAPQATAAGNALPPNVPARDPHAEAAPRSVAAPGNRTAPAPRDRPMAVAATAGQATAIQATADAAPTAAMAEAPVERVAEPLPPAERPAAGAMSQRTDVSLSVTPVPQPVDAGIAGLSPAPAAAPADSPVPTRPAALPQPPPPARQVAQVAIALALGSGQAPRLTVTLEPEALGRVEIRIERGADGDAASVRVLAERPETLALLRRDARELDRALSQAGVPVADGALQFGLSSGDPNQGGRQPGPGPGGGSGTNPDGTGGWGARGAALPAEATRPASLALSLLDIAV